MIPFLPSNPDEVLRLYQGGASIFGLAKACSVTELTMEQFLRGQGVYRKRQAVSRKSLGNGTPQRPIHISGQELSDAWWESNNRAFCDAMDRGYPDIKPSDQ